MSGVVVTWLVTGSPNLSARRRGTHGYLASMATSCSLTSCMPIEVPNVGDSRMESNGEPLTWADGQRASRRDEGGLNTLAPFQ
jgi:hypothetical protein